MNEWIPIAQPSFAGNERKYLLDTIDSGWISSIGKYIDAFERAFADYHGAKHAIATHNGTIALHLALTAAGIAEDDEVIVPDLTFIATSNSVRYCNAVPVLCDVENSDWNLSPSSVKKNLTPKTRAIIPVHLYGNPAAMAELKEIAEQNNLLVIEDCAEALGAEIHGQKVGSFSQISCFSFFGNKVITTGEGGMCLTNDDHLAEQMRILRDHGMNRNKKYWYNKLGFNYRMTNMQAAVGLAQLEQLNDLLGEREKIRANYHKYLKGHPLIGIQQDNGNKTVNWIYTIRLLGFTSAQRDQVMSMLREQGIDSRPVFYPIHEMPFYSDKRYHRHECPNTGRISAEGISLPTFVGLTEARIGRICATLLGILEKIHAE